MISEVSCDTEE